MSIMERFTEAKLAIAKSVDLCAVAENLGYKVRRVGKYYTIKEMDSIRIYSRSHWFRWSRQYEKGENGGSQIDFFTWMTYQPTDVPQVLNEMSRPFNC